LAVPKYTAVRGWLHRASDLVSDAFPWAFRLTVASLLWFTQSLGLALYRASRYDEAIAQLERSNGPGRQPIGYRQNDAILAMGHYREGHSAKARDLFGRVDAWYRRAKAEHDLNELRSKTLDWSLLQVLHREAHTMIVGDPSFPADPFARSRGRRALAKLPEAEQNSWGLPGRRSESHRARSGEGSLSGIPPHSRVPPRPAYPPAMLIASADPR
jgi:hypothetical protein